MMEEDQINQIVATAIRKHSGVPYQYKMNTKKRAIVMRESLESDEEEVEDLQVVEKIEEILCTTYERKTRGLRIGKKGNTPIHINVSVEPINPCATNTPERTPPFRQPNFSGRNTTGNTYTPHGGSSSKQLKMERHDPTIKLPLFQGEASEDPENNLFIYEKRWE